MDYGESYKRFPSNASSRGLLDVSPAHSCRGQSLRGEPPFKAAESMRRPRRTISRTHTTEVGGYLPGEGSPLPSPSKPVVVKEAWGSSDHQDGREDTEGFDALTATSLMKSFDQPYKDGIPSLRDSIAGDERQGYIPSGNAGGDAYQDTMFSCPDAEGKQPLGTSRSRQDENASALHSFSQNSRQLLARLTSATRMISQSICSLVSLKSTKDGRIEIIYEEEDLQSFANSNLADETTREQQGSSNTEKCMKEGWQPPQLNIVVLIVGTRGDVQPFIALGRAMKAYGHRVRLATHATYREWVTSNGLEFYPLGGDPKVLSEYIARNRGILPHGGLADISNQRKQLSAIVDSTYDACTKPDLEGGNDEPFTAECIVANPPSMAHIHCAEKLGVPLHIFFTMPWTPTDSFPHPLALIAGNPKLQPYLNVMNKMSYYTTDAIIWAGNVDLINRFRKNIGLKPIIWMHQGSQIMNILQVPHTYCWSPSLVPKPQDWKDHIDIVGFFFLDESRTTEYTPPEDLVEFLEAGPAPVYVGVGSLVVDDPVGFTKIVYQAAKKTNTRVLLSKGWVGLGDGVEKPPDVFLLGDCPHDWLFTKCSAVVHHGGAGTTAAGLRAACPTTIIPFFGDQTFWGEGCRRAGVGPAPIPIDSLTVDKLVSALKFMQRDEVKQAACSMSARIWEENGVENGLKSFHKQLYQHRDYLADRSNKRVDWSLKSSTRRFTATHVSNTMKATHEKVKETIETVYSIQSTVPSVVSGLFSCCMLRGHRKEAVPA